MFECICGRDVRHKGGTSQIRLALAHTNETISQNNTPGRPQFLRDANLIKANGESTFATHSHSKHTNGARARKTKIPPREFLRASLFFSLTFFSQVKQAPIRPSNPAPPHTFSHTHMNKFFLELNRGRVCHISGTPVEVGITMYVLSISSLSEVQMVHQPIYIIYFAI
jgi:hypothetical protein